MDDVLRNVGCVMVKQVMGGFVTIIKLQLIEYDGLGIKVGNELSLVVNKFHVVPI